RETIDALANCEMDSWDRYDPTFGEYSAKYDEAFFEDNALIVVFAMSPHPGHKYEVLSLGYAEDGQTLVFSFEYKIPVGGWPDICQFDFVMAEVKKEDIADCTSITTEYSEFKNIWGDVNGDQAVNSYDYLMAKRAAFGTYTLDEEEFIRADVYMDRNYVINSADYLLIKRIAFGTYQIW
ncbi:MAG: dockerin type I repeat-containing protein, partial [Clostridia bacterium]|nr:dockerin type I repeat-containing protein [Clostridia bacterium]